MPGRLLVVGDMVSGMATATTPYTGQVFDMLLAAGPPPTVPMESASVPSSPAGCVMTINGRPVAHGGCVTNPPPPGRPLMFCSGISLNGQPVLLELGNFMISPAGALMSAAVSQMSVSTTKAVSMSPTNGPPPPIPGGGSVGTSASPPVRTDFAEPTSVEHVIASRVSTGRLGDVVSDLMHLVGDPVDVASGAVVTWQVDDRSAKYDLAFERRYTSRHSGRQSALGWGWSHSFDQSIWLEVGRVVLQDAGRQIEFDTFDLLDQVARAGAVLRDSTGQLKLICHGRNAWELHDGKSVRYFLPMSGTSSADKDRGFSKLSTIARAGMPLVELHYDDKAQLSSVRCDGNAVFTLRYDRDGYLVAVNDRVARYTYSAAGDLIEAQDLDGNARLYDYSSHLLVRETNRRGGSFYYGYDGHNPLARCVRTWGEGARLHRLLTYENGSTLVTNSLGERTIYEISPIGLVKGFERPDGSKVAYEHDDNLRLVSVRDGDARALDHYDEDGRRVKHRAASGAVWQMEYDHEDRLIGGVDPVGGRWEFGYDLEGRLTSLQDPENHVYRMEYTQGRLSKMTDPLGRVLEFSLGIADEVLEIRAPWQPDVKFEYDAAGNLVGATTASGDEARWYYDGFGRCVGAMRAGKLTQWSRDPEGSVIQLQSDDRLETFVRDVFGRLLRRHGDDLDITYRYDSEDRCLAAACEGGPCIEFTYDEIGRVSKYAIDEAVTEIFRGDDGAIAEIASDAGSVMLTWDAGRLVGCEDGSGKRSYTYREDGLLASFSTEENACTVHRNALGVVIEQTYNDCAVASREVDHRGNRYGVEVTDGPSLFYLWSTAGCLERIGLVGETPFEIDLEISPDASRGVAMQGEGRAEFSNLVSPSQGVGRVVASESPKAPEGGLSLVPPPIPRDALFRPLANAEGARLLWDEGRVLCEGNSVRVYALPAEQFLGATQGEAFVFADPDQASVSSVGADVDVAISACGLVPEPALPASELTVEAFLRHTFARRVWDAQPRPTPGQLAWNPDDWAPSGFDPAVGPVRLDQDALMRWLSPFPAPKLEIISEP